MGNIISFTPMCAILSALYSWAILDLHPCAILLALHLWVISALHLCAILSALHPCAILSALHPCAKNTERMSNYVSFYDELKFGDMTFLFNKRKY